MNDDDASSFLQVEVCFVAMFIGTLSMVCRNLIYCFEDLVISRLHVNNNNNINDMLILLNE